MTVVNGNPYAQDGCGAWIDYNQDFDWEDAGEAITFTPALGGGPYTTTVNVPNTALPGPTTMRVRIVDLSVNTMSPCGITSWGEVEDYGVYISAPIPPIQFTAPTITETCPGLKSIPITVTNFNNVNSFLLVLNWTSGLTYAGPDNINPALSATGQVVFNVGGSMLQANWFSVTPTNIPDGQALFNIWFNTSTGANSLIWQTSGPQSCQFTNLILGVMPSNAHDGLLTYGTCSDVTGTVKYDNTPGTNMANCTVKLIPHSGVGTTYTTTTDLLGHYSFSPVANGIYDIGFSTLKGWNGVNSTDALKVLRHSVHLETLTGLRATAADVVGTYGVYFINSNDALSISKRFVGQSTSWTRPISLGPPVVYLPDWLFEAVSVTVDGTENQVKNFKTICTGDVNGSNIPLVNPAPLKQTASVDLRTEGSILLDGTVELPVYAVDAMNWFNLSSSQLPIQP
jgi:hypothetical protein